MVRSTLVCFAFLATLVQNAGQAAERQYLVKLKICQGKANAKADDPSLKILSAPQLMLLHGKTGIIKSGGEILLPDFGTKVVDHAETGISAEVNCRRVDDESVRLDLKLNAMDVVLNQPESFVLLDLGARVLVKTKLNTTVKTVLKENDKHATWVEVEVEEVMKNGE